jgi:hypothetical protein
MFDLNTGRGVTDSACKRLRNFITDAIGKLFPLTGDEDDQTIVRELREHLRLQITAEPTKEEQALNKLWHALWVLTFCLHIQPEYREQRALDLYTASCNPTVRGKPARSI